MSSLEVWYTEHGRHDLAWRHTTDPWAVLVSEVMLAQTQVQRVEVAWPRFMELYPTIEAAAAATPGDFLIAWGRLGYPRRARWLWESARIVAKSGWPDDYQELPGVGSYTAGALRAQVRDDPDAIGIDVNIRRVVQRVVSAILPDPAVNVAAIRIAEPLVGRDRLLALMDLGAIVCTPREPRCKQCPLEQRCLTRGLLAGETRAKQAPYKGSMREARGTILAALRTDARVEASDFDPQALQTLIQDQLIEVADGIVTLPRV